MADKKKKQLINLRLVQVDVRNTFLTSWQYFSDS